MVAAEPCGRYTYYRLEPAALLGLADRLTGLAEAAAASSGRRRPCP